MILLAKQQSTKCNYKQVLWFFLTIDIYLLLDVFGSLFVCSILIKLIIQLDNKKEKIRS